MFFARTNRWAASGGSTARAQSAAMSRRGSGNTHVGERCSIVTCSARSAIDGAKVMAVAPLPMITTRRPV